MQSEGDSPAHPPDHDFNNMWGSILGAAPKEDRPLSSSLWAELARDPYELESRYWEMLELYTNKFESAGTKIRSDQGKGVDR